MNFEKVTEKEAFVSKEEAQQIADEYLIRKHGNLADAPQAEKDAAAAWVAGDRNYYELLKI